jgi:hypothetical protein
VAAVDSFLQAIATLSDIFGVIGGLYLAWRLAARFFKKIYVRNPGFDAHNLRGLSKKGSSRNSVIKPEFLYAGSFSKKTFNREFAI